MRLLTAVNSYFYQSREALSNLRVGRQTERWVGRIGCLYWTQERDSAELSCYRFFFPSFTSFITDKDAQDGNAMAKVVYNFIVRLYVHQNAYLAHIPFKHG